MHLLALLAPFVLALPAPTDMVEEAIDALIERTNALEGFTAEYSISGPEESAGSIRFEYLAPDRFHAVYAGAFFGGSLEVWVVGDDFCLWGDQGEEPAVYGRLGVQESMHALTDLLGEHFADPRWKSLAPGPVIAFELSHDAKSDRANFEVSLAPQMRRPALLGWLPIWREQRELLELSEDSIVLTHARFGATIPLDSGFPSEMWLIGKDGERRVIRLESLSEGAGPEEASFEFPESCPVDARDVSEDMRLRNEWKCRELSLRCIDAALADGRVRWSEAVKGNARAVLRALHAPRFEERRRQSRAEISQWIESYAGRLARKRDKGESLEALRDEVAKTRTELEDRGAEECAGALKAIASGDLPPGDSAQYDDLLELEAEVIGALCAEIVGQPVMQEFDEATDDVLGD